MSVIGSMTVSIDATAHKASPAFRKVFGEAKGLQSALSKIGSMKVAPGSILSRDVLFTLVRGARDQFMGMVHDVQKLDAEARKAKVSIEELTKGAFTADDVAKTNAFTKALERLNTALRGGRKDLLIDISPLATDAINKLANAANRLFEIADKIQGFGAFVGDAAGNALVPAQTGAAGSTTPSGDAMRNAARVFNAVTSQGQSELLPAIMARISQPSRPSTRSDHRANMRTAQEQTELMRKIEKNTSASGGITVDVKEAKLSQ